MSKKATYIIFALLACLALFCAYDLFSGKNIPNNGNTINAVGDDIQSAGNQLDTISTGIDELESTSQSIKQSADRIEEINGSNTELIAKCKQIVRDIREGNQSGTAANQN